MEGRTILALLLLDLAAVLSEAGGDATFGSDEGADAGATSSSADGTFELGMSAMGCALPAILVAVASASNKERYDDKETRVLTRYRLRSS